MKVTLNYIKVAMFLLLGLFIVGCEEDTPGGGTGGGNLDDPDISLGSSSVFTVDTNEEFTFTVTASSNADPLQSITIYEGSDKVDLERIKYDGEAASANPTLLFGGDKAGFTKDITIQAHATVDEKAYTVEVMDEGGRKAEVVVDVTTTGNPPSFVFTGSGSIQVDPGVNVKIGMIAEKGSSDLYSVTVYENNQVIEDYSRLEFAGLLPESNPFGLTDAFLGGFEEDIIIKAPNEAGEYVITIVVTDEAGLTASDDYTITVGPIGTPVEAYEGFLLLNSAGPVGTGGADLDISSGSSSVGSSDPNAEIQDLGIDQDLDPANNWIQKISGANDALLRQAIAGTNGLSESFSFDQVQTKEQIEQIYNNSQVLTGNTSDVVQVGDVFTVSRDGKYYILEITEVNPTTSDNDDYYVFEVKR